MTLSLTNSKDIVANSVTIVSGNDAVDVGDGLANAQTILETKADKATTYTVEYTNFLLDAKVDDTELENFTAKANPTLIGTIRMNTIDTIPNAGTYPDLNVLQNLKVGTGLTPKNLTALGNSSVAGTLGVLGVTTLDDANIGTLALSQSGTNNNLNVYGNASLPEHSL